jgi:tetratricopeptide (TPR) repeat protein
MITIKKLRTFSLAAVIMVGLPGCVVSKKPLSDARQSRVDNRFFGTWRMNEDNKTITIVCRQSETKGHPPGMMRYERTEVDHKTNTTSKTTAFFFITHLGDYSYLNLLSGFGTVAPTGGERRTVNYDIPGDYEAFLGSDFEQYSFLMYSISRDRVPGRETLTIWEPSDEVGRKAVVSGAIKGEVGDDGSIFGKGSVMFKDSSENLARLFKSELGLEMFRSGKESVLVRIDRGPEPRVGGQDQSIKKQLEAVADALPLIELGQYAAAIRKLNAVIAQDPANGVAYAARADALLMGLPFQSHEKEQVRKTAQAAIDDSQAALRSTPDLLMPYKLMGKAYMELSDWRASLQAYDKFIQNSPAEKDPETFSGRALARQELGDFRGALDDYSKAITLDGKKYSMLETRAKLYLKLNDPDHALSDYEAAINLLKAKARNSFDENEIARLQFNHAETRRARGDAEGADRELFEMIKAGGVSLKMVRLRLDQNYPAVLGRLIARNPDSPELYRLRAEANEDRSDKSALAQARDDYTKVVELSANEEQHRSALVRRARIQQKLGNLDAALADIRSAQQLGEDSSLYLQLASIYFAKSDWSGIVEAYSKALKVPTRPKSDDNYLYMRRAEAYRKLGQLEQARADLDQSLKLSPSYYPAYGMRGLVLTELHRDQEAESDFKRCASLNQNYFDKTVLPELKEIRARRRGEPATQPR